MGVTLTTDPADRAVLLPYEPLTAVAGGLDPSSNNRNFIIRLYGMQIYAYNDGSIIVDPSYAHTTQATANGIHVTLTSLSAWDDSSPLNFAMSYSDSVTSLTTVNVSLLSANLTVLARSPDADRSNVPTDTAISFTLANASGASAFATLDATVDATPALLSSVAQRPDWAASVQVFETVATASLRGRRRLPSGSTVSVAVTAHLTTDSIDDFTRTFAWRFYVAPDVSAPSDPGLRDAPFDRQSSMPAFELVRRTTVGAVRTALGTAPTGALLLYRVRDSGLASLAAECDPTGALTFAANRLRAVDLTPAVAAAHALAPVAVLWPPTLDELVRMRALYPEVAALLARAWGQGDPRDRLGASCALVLLASPRVG